METKTVDATVTLAKGMKTKTDAAAVRRAIDTHKTGSPITIAISPDQVKLQAAKELGILLVGKCATFPEWVEFEGDSCCKSFYSWKIKDSRDDRTIGDIQLDTETGEIDCCLEVRPA